MVVWSQLSVLEENLQSIHPLILPLLEWLLAIGRCPLRLLSQDEIPSVQPPLSLPPLSLPSSPLSLSSSDPVRASKQSLSLNFFLKWSLKENQTSKRSSPCPLSSPLPLLSSHTLIVQLVASASASSSSSGRSNETVFLFHGSSLENWHSILRLGLKNFSNTKYMSHGAAHGPGVYLSQSLSVSSQYVGGAAQNKIWTKSQILEPNGGDSCQAICEAMEDTRERGAPRDIFVIADERSIAIRYLLITPDRTACTVEGLSHLNRDRI
jgi:hypothetical protein